MSNQSQMQRVAGQSSHNITVSVAEETAANRDLAISILCMHCCVKFSYTRLHLFRLDGAAPSDMSWALSNMMKKEIKEKPVVIGEEGRQKCF